MVKRQATKQNETSSTSGRQVQNETEPWQPLTDSLLYRVTFADGGEWTVVADGPLDAALKASRAYNKGRKAKVRVLKAIP